MSKESSSFIYSFVAGETMVLAEYTEFTGNFPAIASQCLHKLHSSNNNFTHSFNFLLHDGYGCQLWKVPSTLFGSYCVVAEESVSKQISISFLERVKEDFKKRYGGGKADTTAAKSLNKEFGPVMKEHMKYILENDEEIDKLAKVNAQVSEVKSIMMENIDKAINRGENTTILADKTQNLRDQSQAYSKQGTQIRRKLWYQNMKIKLVVLGILLLLILVIWISVCHGFNCTNYQRGTNTSIKLLQIQRANKGKIVTKV